MNQFRSLDRHQVKFDPPQRKIKSISTTQTKTKSISMPTLESIDLRPHRNLETFSTTTTNKKNKSIDSHTQNKLSSARIRSSSISRKKNKLLSIQTWKPSQIRSLTKKKKMFLTLLKWCQFDPYSKIKSISINSQKNQVIFDQHTKTNYFSNRTKKRSQFLIHTLK